MAYNVVIFVRHEFWEILQEIHISCKAKNTVNDIPDTVRKSKFLRYIMKWTGKRDTA